MGGISLRLTGADLFLWISFLLTTPALLATLKPLAIKTDFSKKNAKIHGNTKLYQDYLNFGAGALSLVFDDNLFDGIVSFCVKLIVNILLILVSPLVYVLRLLFKGGAYLLRAKPI